MAERRRMCSLRRSSLMVVVQAALLAALALGYGCHTASARLITAEQRLANAIDSAATSTRVVVFTLTEDVLLTKPLPLIAKLITIKGSCGARKCVIDGAGKYGIFAGYNPDGCLLTIENLILQNAAEGAFTGKCNLKFKGVVFRNNKAHAGGAVGIGLGTAAWHIEDCLFEKNEAKDIGGALAITSNGRGRILRTTFKSNTAGTEGGAVYISSLADRHVFDHVIFYSNTAGSNGGGMFIAPRAATDSLMVVFISHCTFTKNAATGGHGGGLALAVLLDARICHCTLAGGENEAKDGKGSDVAFLNPNYGRRMTVAFCPGKPKNLSHFTYPVITNPGGTNEPIIRDHCHGCKPPK